MRCSVRLSRTVAVVAVLAGLACVGSAEASGPVTLEVAAGDCDREGVVVAAEVPEAMRGERVALTQVDTGEAVPVQWECGDKPRLVWIVREKLAAGEVRRYRLSAGGGEAAGEAVKVEDDGKHLNVSVGGKPVLVYNHAVVPSPDPKQPYYARSGHIHPVYSPSGQVVTDDFNPDHMHQHGIMFAWTKSTFEGRPANCWDQKGGQGTVEHVKLEAVGGGPVFGYFTAKLRHVSLNGPEGRKPILDETWDVRVYNFGDYFLFDLTSSQTCAGASPLVVEEYHYGGMAIRGSAAWPATSGADFLTSEGKTRADGNHTRPRWCDIYGPVDGGEGGVCILGHPTNFRFPQHVRLHPSMPYFCYSPAVLGAFSIEPGKPPYVSQYRFYVHDGRPNAKAAERLWQDYAEPPEVRIVSQ
ncbi:MAG TPA: PmoA family protein [Thermoguttaceae bacterium]|nr:PmoA family protein [Thermoguttaceae bacterium]